MSKPTVKFKKLHDDLTDCVEYIATYGTSNLNSDDQTYLAKISYLAEEYLRVMEEEGEGTFDDEDEDFEEEEQ
jgi:hypothetical protein